MAPSMHTLNVISGPASGQSVDLDGEIVIGREDADLNIPDPELSRRHAAVRPANGGVEIEDLGSTNGTFVDGRQIDAPTKLSVSGMLRLGTSEIQVNVQLGAQATRARGVVADPQRTRVAGAPEPQGPDVTRARPAAAGPPQAAEPEPAAPAQPAAAAQPAPPAEAGEAPPGPPWGAGKPPWGDGPPPWGEGPPPWGEGPPPWARKGGPPPAWLLEGRPPPLRIKLMMRLSRAGPAALGIAVVLAAAIVALVIFLATSAIGGGTEKQTLTGALRTAVIRDQGERLRLGGTQTGRPTGEGSVIMNETFEAPLEQLRGETRVTAKIESRFDDGTIKSDFRGTARRQQNGAVRVAGTATITSGTRGFEGAEGSYRLAGTQRPGVQAVSFEISRGSIEF